MVYGQPPPGLDIKTTIDMQLQQEADRLLEGRKGALVLLNAQTGEVLAMASHPNVDPNQAESMWSGWMQDSQSPLLNRATQAAYPLGTLLAPFLLTERLDTIQDREPPGSMDIQYNGVNYSCGFNPEKADSWEAGIIAGCPAPSIALAGSFSAEEISGVIEEFGFMRFPEFILPQAAFNSEQGFDDPKSLIFGEDQLRVSPLQVALAASAITNNTNIPSPLLAVSYRSPDGWVYFPHSQNNNEMNLEIGNIQGYAFQYGIPWVGSIRAIKEQPGDIFLVHGGNQFGLERNPFGDLSRIGRGCSFGCKEDRDLDCCKPPQIRAEAESGDQPRTIRAKCRFPTCNTPACGNSCMPSTKISPSSLTPFCSSSLLPSLRVEIKWQAVSTSRIV